MTIDFWFEFGSTYSYPAAMRVEKLASQHGIKVNWRAFLLGAVFREQGLADSPFNLYPAKGRYMWHDLERTCKALGIPFQRPSEFPRNGLLAARVACCFDDAPWVGNFIRAVYRANFVVDTDIADPVVISSCIARAGEDPDAVLERAQAPESREKLREQTDEAMRIGIFGAPTVAVGDELFWGNDRLEEALAWAISRGG
jgi:2-hydroxychromene-2-carboxylate isomerase